jgi:GNAT superfamily N-acetyltransferase
MEHFLRDSCKLHPIGSDTMQVRCPFSCGDSDLDDFFAKEAHLYNKQLLGKSYCYCLNSDPREIVCAFTLANSSVDARNLPNSRRKKLTENIPHEKSLSTYPATLIGRLAVSKNYNGRGIGSELLNYIKFGVTDPNNRAACRYLTVDAYNNEATLKFYEANGFKFLFSTEEQEKEHIGMQLDRELKTRLMYYDLILIE